MEVCITWYLVKYGMHHYGLFYIRNQDHVQPKSIIPIGAKIKIKPKGFTQEVKAKREKNILIYPMLLINVELYCLVLAPRLIKGYHQTWEANL
jgi:hypothetical protein